jgi:acyl-CoA synthetase (AMP-forming)/AMP-acid ligase II
LALGGAVKEITYDELLSGALRYARTYDELQVPSGGVIIIILKHSLDLYFAFLGAILSQRIPSILAFPSIKQDPALYWRDHQQLFCRIGASVLVTYAENLPIISRKVGTLDLAVVTPEQVLSAEPRQPDQGCIDQIAFLQHSSGTTGLKKGVALSHGAVLRQVAAYNEVIRLGDGDRIVSWLPLYHDMGLIACFISPLVLGVPIVVMDPFEWSVDPLMLLDAMERYRGTHAWLPNFAFMHLARAASATDRRYRLEHVRAFINCSEPCKPESFDEFLRAFGEAGITADKLQVCYAMAETVFGVSQTALSEPARSVVADRGSLADGRFVPCPPSKSGRRLLSAGAPIPGVEVRVVSDDGRVLGEDEVGEVAVRGPFLFSGYFRQPEETAKKLRDGWYYTGDLGFSHSSECYVLGRKDDVLILNGRNYYAHDIEFFAAQVAGVKAGRVAAIDLFNRAQGSQEIVVLAETLLSDPSCCDPIIGAVRRHLMSALGTSVRVVLVPSGWIVKTTSGKMSRKENARKYLESTLPGMYEVL